MANVTVSNTSSQLSGKTVDLLESDQTISGQKTFSRGASAPFVVLNGSAVVQYLDADKLDGQEGSYYLNASNLASGSVPDARRPNPVEQTTTSTGTQNDFSLSGKLTILRCNNASALVFTGFTVGGAAPAAGDRVIIENIGSSTVKVTNQDAGSTAANRAIFPSTQGQILGASGSMTLAYDGTTARWRIVSVEPGEAISYTPAWTSNGAAPAIGNGSIAGAYIQRGREVWFRFQFSLGGTSTVGTGNYRFSLPLTSSAALSQFSGKILDAGVAHYVVVGSTITSTATFEVYRNASGGAVDATDVTLSTANDSLNVSGTYEAA